MSDLPVTTDRPEAGSEGPEGNPTLEPSPAIRRLLPSFLPPTSGFERGARLVVDGRYGPNTAGEVLAFQRGKGLEADGVVGPRPGRPSGSCRSDRLQLEDLHEHDPAGLHPPR